MVRKCKRQQFQCLINGVEGRSKPWELKEVAPAWLNGRGRAGGVTLSVSRPTPNRKSSKMRLASRVFAKLPHGDWWLLFHGRTFSLLPYFLILIIDLELRQPTVQSESINSDTKQDCATTARKIHQWLLKGMWSECWATQKAQVKLLEVWKKNKSLLRVC